MRQLRRTLRQSREHWRTRAEGKTTLLRQERRTMGTLPKRDELDTEASSTSKEDAVKFGNERPRAPWKPQPCLRRDRELLRQSNW